VNSSSDDKQVVKRALIEIKKLRSDLDVMERERSEPIAIIGMSCRFPGGAHDPESYWRLMRDGVDATCDIPAGRWDIDALYDPNPGIPGKMYTRRGGYLGPVDAFDARFFGISPREATNMDPQHRYLLEVSWEALEDAGYASGKLTGSRTGVFIGIYTNDYANLFEFADIDAYMSTGNSFSAAAGRISYTFGLQGPCMPVDTACSSSIVAVHLACQSLRNRESDTAIAGGINMILSPIPAIALSKLRVMAPDGRCKTFSETADGFGRGEGCGVIILKRLSDAIADNDRILALIRGSAVNEDGRSGGLTVPNGLAQEAVIRRALEKGHVSPEAVSYIEAHGTGTPLGDPIEVHALGAVFGKSHTSERPLLIGSVKTNIGHLESASGIAGLIKVVLSFQHKQIPPHLHLTTPNPHIPWDKLPVAVPAACTPWESPQGPRIAGVSAFGYSGINAHVVLEEAPVAAIEKAPAVERPVHLLCLSARDEGALAELIGRYANLFETSPAIDLGNACHTANTGRTHFSNRVAVVAGTVEQARDRLSKHRRGETGSGMARGYVDRPSSPEVVFLFTGQGAQYAGMGRQLYQTQPLFRKVLDECDAILRPLMEQPLLSVLFADGGPPLLNQTGYTQPALFALEYALAQLWRSWGVEPAIVVGHSVGEYAAACVAGMFSLEDGLSLIAERARLMQNLQQRGAMEAIFAGESAVAEAIKPYATKVAIAALNGPDNTVISGDADGVRSVVDGLKKGGISSQPLTVSHAFHSPLMDAMLDPLENAAARVHYSPLQINLISNLTGRPLEDDPGGMPKYWRRHAREAVRFADGIASIRESGHRIFIEIGPSPTLIGMARKCISGNDCVMLPSLRRGAEDWQVMLESLGNLYVRGMDVDWTAFDRDYSRRKIALPTYPFQRERYWLENPRNQSLSAPAESSSAGDGASWPLAGSAQRSALKEVLFDSRIGIRRLPYLQDHRVFGVPVLPAAAFLEMGLEAGNEVLGAGPTVLEQVVIHEPLLLREEAVRVQTVLTPESAVSGSFRVYAGSDGPRPSWRLHASGNVMRTDLPGTPGELPGDLDDARSRCNDEISASDFYSALQERNLEYGNSFQGIERLWRGRDESLARLRLPGGLETDAGRYRIHPALLDACLQVTAAATSGTDGDDLYLPLSIDRMVLRASPGANAWCHAVVRESDSGNRETLIADFRLFDDTGHVLAQMAGLRLKRASHTALMRSMQLKDPAGDPGRWLHDLRWTPAQAAAGKPMQAGAWLVFCEDQGAGPHLAGLLQAQGHRCVRVYRGSTYEATPAGMKIDPRDPEHFRRLVREHGAADLRGVVYLWQSGTAEQELSSPELGAVGALHLLQAIATAKLAKPPRLWLATTGAQAIDDKTPLSGLTQSPLWGLGRVIALEHPELRCTRVDMDASADSAASAALLFQEISAEDKEDQIAFRKGVRKVARLGHSAGDRLRIPTGQPYRLDLSTGGILDKLSFKPIERRAPSVGEIEIETRAAGLNFLDVMDALGVLPFQRHGFGGESAGTVVAVGEGVDGFKVGDEVFGMVIGNLHSHSFTQAAVAARKPSGLSFEEAAAIPITFLTVYRALYQLARLSAGDRVLIHAAAGGVGLTAVQLAQRVGAEVFATAGSPEKREFLKSLGVRHVADSRSLNFAAEFRDATGGRGVDVVLNSLAGEFIPASLSTLAPGGRFVEIGKTGVWSADRVASMRSDVSYYLYDLVRHSIEDPLAVGSMLREIVKLFESGELRPIRQQVFPISNAPAAFRLMAQARHIGKVVLSFRDGNEQVKLRRDGTYLITGGLGALGLGLARWMAERGAGHLLLAGRRAASEDAAPALRAIEEAGAKVTIAQADISRFDDAKSVVALAGSSLPPLRGVVHAAGVLDDGVLLEQNLNRFTTVFAPKVKGAWNLHQLTQEQPLDFFVLFSSMASILGNPGQANYAAANAFLDALAPHRRALGLPGLAIGWGPWEDGGMWSAKGKRRRNQRNNGIGTISAEAGFECFERLLGEQRAYVAVLPVDWRELLRQFPPGSAPPVLEDLAKESDSGSQAGEVARDTQLLERIAAALPSERLDIVTSFVSGQVVKVLGLDATRHLDPRQPLNELGLDSLMAVELRNALAGSLGLTLPATLLFDYPSPRTLVEFLMVQLAGPQESEKETAAKEQEVQAAMMNEIKTLSDQEAEESLLKELKQAGY